MDKFKQINSIFKEIVANAPLALLAFPASWNVGSFESTVLPVPVCVVMGAAFESTYLGAMIFARNKDRKTFIVTIAIAVTCASLYGFLNAAQNDPDGNLLKNQWYPLRYLLAFIHGAPFPIIGIFYAWLLHFKSDDNRDSENQLNAVSNELALTRSDLERALAEIEKGNKDIEQFGQQMTSAKTVILDLQAKLREAYNENQRLKNDKIVQLPKRLEGSILDLSPEMEHIKNIIERCQTTGEKPPSWQVLAKELGIARTTLIDRVKKTPLWEEYQRMTMERMEA